MLGVIDRYVGTVPWLLCPPRIIQLACLQVAAVVLLTVFFRNGCQMWHSSACRRPVAHHHDAGRPGGSSSRLRFHTMHRVGTHAWHSLLAQRPGRLRLQDRLEWYYCDPSWAHMTYNQRRWHGMIWRMHCRLNLQNEPWSPSATTAGHTALIGCNPISRLCSGCSLYQMAHKARNKGPMGGPTHTCRTSLSLWQTGFHWIEYKTRQSSGQSPTGLEPCT